MTGNVVRPWHEERQKKTRPAVTPRAFRGFNPHHRKVPSYYPILAHVAETTHILRVKNRSGNVHDGKASLPFLRELWEQVVAILGRRRGVRFRMDAAFFREDVLRWLRGP
jgi:hypothetical protein